MRPSFRALALVLASIMWLYAFAEVTTKGTDASQSKFLGVVVFAAPFLLPILGFLLVRKQPRSLVYKWALFPAFIISLMPPAIFLCVLLVVFFVPGPGRIYTRGASRISVGMTKAQVVQKIGLPERAVADGSSETISYILERPFHHDRLFYVKFVDGKVVSCEIRDQ